MKAYPCFFSTLESPQPPILFSSASSVIPASSTNFRLLAAPCTIRISRLGRPRRSASSAINASLAAPSTGGAVRRALSTLCSHAKLFLLLRGTTCTVMRIISIPDGLPRPFRHVLHLPARRQRLQQ